MKKNTIMCINCGKYGHEQKACKIPITSWGVILIQNNNIQKNKHINCDLTQYNQLDGIRLYSKEDYLICSTNMEQIQFLLVRRKHSLGFNDFIRGNYAVHNVRGILGLFNQMVKEEIELIKTKTFDELWLYFWGGEQQADYKYTSAYAKFSQLINNSDNITQLNYYVTNAKPMYLTSEWGFPKGRKKRNERDLDCAIREFCEETSISESQINILHNIQPIVEDLCGTNGVYYRHIYYIAELKDNLGLDLNKIKNNISINYEIGDINFFNYNDCMDIIREYHIEKKKILTCLMNYYNSIYQSIGE